MGRFFPIATAFLLAVAPPALAGGAPPHWIRPIKAVSADMGADALRPQACAVCHSSKYEEWRGALHGRSAGPGLLFQLDSVSAPEFYAGCLYCHGPLASQSEVLEKKEGGYAPNPSFDINLMESGVNCAVCHVRDGRVVGPPSPTVAFKGEAAHVSVQDELFESPGFCAACHQLDEGYGFGGRPLVNTFREWEDSPYMKRGITCQKCHMPGRRHLFRGIHDPETVRQGVKIEVVNKGRHALIRLTNTGAGHYFPTYVTPLVVVRGFQADGAGEEVEGTLKEAYIGRRVSLDLSKEFFDTRLAPDASFELDYGMVKRAEARSIVFEVRVYPDEFYSRFFKDALREADKERKGLVKAALEGAVSSPYLLFRDEVLF